MNDLDERVLVLRSDAEEKEIELFWLQCTEEQWRAIVPQNHNPWDSADWKVALTLHHLFDRTVEVAGVEALVGGER